MRSTRGRASLPVHSAAVDAGPSSGLSGGSTAARQLVACVSAAEQGSAVACSLSAHAGAGEVRVEDDRLRAAACVPAARRCPCCDAAPCAPTARAPAALRQGIPHVSEFNEEQIDAVAGGPTLRQVALDFVPPTREHRRASHRLAAALLQARPPGPSAARAQRRSRAAGWPGECVRAGAAGGPGVSPGSAAGRRGGGALCVHWVTACRRCGALGRPERRGAARPGRAARARGAAAAGRHGAAAPPHRARHRLAAPQAHRGAVRQVRPRAAPGARLNRPLARLTRPLARPPVPPKAAGLAGAVYPALFMVAGGGWRRWWAPRDTFGRKRSRAQHCSALARPAAVCAERAALPRATAFDAQVPCATQRAGRCARPGRARSTSSS